MKCFFVIIVLLNIWATITAHPSGGVVEIEKQRLIKFPDDSLQYQTIEQSNETQRILEEINKININLGYVKKQEPIQHTPISTILNSEQYLYPRPAYHPAIHGGVVLPTSIRNLRYNRRRPVNRSQYNYRANYSPFYKYENYYPNVYFKVPIVESPSNFRENFSGEYKLEEIDEENSNFIQNIPKNQKLNNMYKIHLVGDLGQFMKSIEESQKNINKENGGKSNLPIIFLPAKIKTYEEVQNELTAKKINYLKNKSERQRVNNKVKEIEKSLNNNSNNKKVISQQPPKPLVSTDLQQQQQQRLKFGIFNRPPQQQTQQFIAATTAAPLPPVYSLQENSVKISNIKESDDYDSGEDSAESSQPYVKHLLAQFQNEKHDTQKEAIKQGGIIIQRLKVRKGGIAIAGPGGVATAGSGGTAIVGPGGFALTHPKSLTIAGPGAKVIAYPETVNLGEAALRTNRGNIPEGGKIVATGPTIYYNPATIYQTGNVQTWPLYALPFPQLPIIQSSQSAFANQANLREQIQLNSILQNSRPQQTVIPNQQVAQSIQLPIQTLFNSPTQNSGEQQNLLYPANFGGLSYAPLQYYQLPFGNLPEQVLEETSQKEPEPTTQRPISQDRVTTKSGLPEKLIENKNTDVKIVKSVVRDLQFLSAIQQPNKKFVIERIVPVPGTQLFQITTLENDNQSKSQRIQRPNGQKLSLKKQPQKLIQAIQSLQNTNNKIEDTTVKVEVTGHTAADQPVPDIPIGAYFVPYFGGVNFPENQNNGQQASLILEPQAKSVAGNSGTAVSAPISRAILKKGINTRVFFRPQSVAIAGAGGTAHAQADLILDYVNRRK